VTSKPQAASAGDSSANMRGVLQENSKLEQLSSVANAISGLNPGSSSRSEVVDPVFLEKLDHEKPSGFRREDKKVEEVVPTSRTIQDPWYSSSDVDFLDDGYCWWKYGQNVVKGNLHPGNHHFGQLLDDGSYTREISVSDVDSEMSVRKSMYLSQHSGVRFRLDLGKWVAEIKIPGQSESFDKKIWLGTYISEVQAALAVDAARKVLKCSKEKPNFPCERLEAFTEVLPPHLSLNDPGMLKSVSEFVKCKAKQYASEFSSVLPISIVVNQGIGAHTPVTQKNKQPDFGDESSSKSAPPISRV
jgi:hypothetical protein